MKSTLVRCLALFAVAAFAGCNSTSNDNASTDSTSNDTPPSFSVSEGSYVDLNTGKPITLIRDAEKGIYLYSDTKKPIDNDFMFVEASTNDTLYGKTGVVVNTALKKSDNGSWTLNESMIDRNGDEIKIKTADGKLKVDGDEMKYKEGRDTKVKVDDEESKTKTSDSKTKTDEDEFKSKTPDSKVKVDN